MITAEQSETILAVWGRPNLKLEALMDVSDGKYFVEDAFDGKPDTCWLKSGAPGYLRFKTAEPVVVSQMVMDANVEKAPYFYALLVLENEEEFLKITDPAKQNRYLRDPDNWMPIAAVDNKSGTKYSVRTFVDFDGMRQYYSFYCKEAHAFEFNVAELRLYPLENPCDLVFTDGSAEEMYSIEQGEAFVLPACGYKKDGYRFIGWQQEGETALKQPGESITAPAQASCRFTAQWEKPETVRATVSGGNIPDKLDDFVVSIPYGGSYKLPYDGMAQRHLFAGWYVNGALHGAVIQSKT